MRSETAIPDVRTLPGPVARIAEDACGAAVGHVPLVAAPLMALSVVAIAFIREVPLRRQSGTELAADLERGVPAPRCPDHGRC